MYESHWQLARRPFEAGTDVSWYYPSEAHQGALLKLRYAVESRCPAALLAGGSGTGKTLLVRLLAERLADTYRPFVHLVYPAMPTAELLAYLAAELDGPDDSESLPTIDRSVRRIQQTLEHNASEGRHAVVTIDEAHLLEGGRTFEALRLLLNFEASSRPGLTLLVVGQSALLPMIDRMPQFDERLGMKCLLRSLAEEETMSYIEHRLTLAGAQRPIFSPTALEAIHRITQGNPRRINRLCDLALLIGFADEQRLIGDEHIEAVANELVTVTPEG
ncbi:MAG TPA: AAA family ATPase [Pirellulales bacterium]|jgi:general secretion pathway protein A|nr:AAA family ATPase [Pirellulales bacterium]